MDPISIILAAALAGAASGAAHTADQSIRDAYESFKTAIRRRLAGSSSADVILTEVESNPEVWKEPLRNELMKVSAEQDQQLISSAQQLLQLIEGQQAVQSKYNVQVRGNVEGLAQGDHQHVAMRFDRSGDV